MLFLVLLCSSHRSYIHLWCEGLETPQPVKTLSMKCAHREGGCSERLTQAGLTWEWTRSLEIKRQRVLGEERCVSGSGSPCLMNYWEICGCPVRRGNSLSMWTQSVRPAARYPRCPFRELWHFLSPVYFHFSPGSHPLHSACIWNHSLLTWEFTLGWKGRN